MYKRSMFTLLKFGMTMQLNYLNPNFRTVNCLKGITLVIVWIPFQIFTSC